MITQKEYKFLRFVEFAELVRWDVKTYINSNSTNKNLVCLGDYIKEQSKKVKLFDYSAEEFGILGVNNQIGIFDAYLEKGEKINQPYKEMQENWLAYNPYRINVGSIGIKTKEHKYKYISPAYVVFSCKESLDSEFLFNVFKTDAFNKLIVDNTTGSVRQNLSFTNLSQIQLAIPPLPTQQTLVENYKTKTTLANQKEQKANELEKSIDEYLIEELGIEIQKKEVVKSEYKFLRFVGFEELKEWEYSRFFNKTEIKSKYKLEKLETICNNFKNGVNFKGEQVGSGTKFVNIKDIYNDKYINNSNLECVNLSEKEIKSNKLQNNDLIFVRSSVKYEGVAFPSLFKDSNEDIVFCGFLIKCSPNINLINPKYLLFLLRSQLYRNIVINLSTKTIITNISQDKLKSIQLPLPPLSIQEKIANHISDLKEQIKKLRTEAEGLKTNAKAEFEGVVFG